MKTLIILAFLSPLLVYALCRLYLYIARFNEQKCGCCPFASSCGPREKASCAPDKKNFTAHL